MVVDVMRCDSMIVFLKQMNFRNNQSSIGEDERKKQIKSFCVMAKNITDKFNVLDELSESELKFDKGKNPT